MDPATSKMFHQIGDELVTRLSNMEMSPDLMDEGVNILIGKLEDYMDDLDALDDDDEDDFEDVLDGPIEEDLEDEKPEAWRPKGTDMEGRPPY